MELVVRQLLTKRNGKLTNLRTGRYVKAFQIQKAFQRYVLKIARRFKLEKYCNKEFNFMDTEVRSKK